MSLEQALVRMAAQICLAYLLLLVLSAIWRLFPLASLSPDIVALFGAYLGLTARDKLAPSLAAALVLGYLADLLLGSPVGLMAMVGGLVCTACHLIQGRLLVRGVIFTIVFATFTALAAGIFVLIVRGAAGLLPLGWIHALAGTMSSVLLTGLLGPFVFRACRLVDSRFARTRRERAAAAAGVV